MSLPTTPYFHVLQIDEDLEEMPRLKRQASNELKAALAQAVAARAAVEDGRQAIAQLSAGQPLSSA